MFSDAESLVRYLTPDILLAAAAMWFSAPLLALVSVDTPITEWPFSDYRIVAGFVWPTILATLHVGCAIVHFSRARVPGLPFIAYTSLLALLAFVAAYYFLAHGLAVSTNPLPFILALNMPPLVFIAWAWQSRTICKPA